MKAFIIASTLIVLGVVAFFAFGVATIRRESEIAMHLFGGEDFVRFRIICIAIGIVAVLVDVFLIWLLCRRTPEEK